jgi:ADP-heptose:LPS heptosyltransferase
MKIAVIRLSAMGDIIHVLPLLHVLKRNLKQHQILLVTQKRFASWAGSAPFVDGVAAVDLSSRSAIRDSVRTLRDHGLDGIVDAQGLYKSAFLALRAGAALRVGFGPAACREPLSAFFHHRRVGPSGTHIIDRNLSLAAAVGCGDLSLDGYSLDFLPADPAGRVRDFLNRLEGRSFVLFHPFSSRAAKDFPLEPVGALRACLRERSMELIVSCGPGQEERGGAAAQALRGVPVPLFSVREMALLIAKAACVIAPDTGFLHVADGLRIPTISSFTHLPPERNGPYFTPGLTFWRVPPDPARMAAFMEGQ